MVGGSSQSNNATDSHYFLPELISFFGFFWLHWVFVAVHGLSLVAASRDYSSLWCVGFSLRWLLLLRSTDSRHVDFSSCSMQASVVVAHGLSGCGLQALEGRLSSCGVASRHVGSSRTRARTRVPCISR